MVDEWNKLGTNTLTSPADNISNTITEKKFLEYMLMKINTGGAVNPTLTFNSDSAANYAYRYASNGAADVPLVNQSKIEMTKSGATPTSLVISYSINISTEEKLVIINDVESSATGAGTAPNRMEVVGKWVNTSAQITTVNFGNDAAGDYDTGANATVFGTD